MSSMIVVGVVLVVGGGLLAALVAGIAVLVATRAPGPSPSEAAAAARRHAGAMTLLAWVAAAVGALVVGPAVVGSAPGLLSGVAVGLLPAIAGLAHVGVHAVGEVTWPRPTGAVRRAALRVRTVRDVTPRTMTRAVATWLVALVVVAAAGSLTAGADGRSVVRTFPGGSAVASPYPGWFYAVPLLVGGLVVVAAAAAVLRLVATRPAVVDTAPEWDLQMRRLSAHRVLRGVQLALGLTVAGQLLAAGMALRSVAWAGHGEPPAPLADIAPAACLLLAAVAGLVAFALAGLPGPAPVAPRAPDAGPPTTALATAPGSAPDGAAPTPRGHPQDRP